MSNFFKSVEKIEVGSASIRQQVLEMPPSLEKKVEKRDGTSVKA